MPYVILLCELLMFDDALLVGFFYDFIFTSFDKTSFSSKQSQINSDVSFFNILN